MAQSLLTQKRNVRTKLKPSNREILLPDWDEWLRKLELNPGFYDDARESHMSGLCKCGCTRAFTLEVRKKKK
jgi:hypothetical protein